MLPLSHDGSHPADETATATQAPDRSPPPLDLSVERLDAQDEIRWKGRPLSELSDTELAAAAEGIAVLPPPDLPSMRSQRNWLKLRVTWPQRRLPLHLRVDEIVVEWFRRDGPGHQARMNAVLRAYVDAQIEAESRSK